MAACIFCALAPTLWMSCLCTSQKKAYHKCTQAHIHASAYPRRHASAYPIVFFCGACEIVATASHTGCYVGPARLSPGFYSLSHFVFFCGACEIVATASLWDLRDCRNSQAFTASHTNLPRTQYYCVRLRAQYYCVHVYLCMGVRKHVCLCVTRNIFVCGTARNKISCWLHTCCYFAYFVSHTIIFRETPAHILCSNMSRTQ